LNVTLIVVLSVMIFIHVLGVLTTIGRINKPQARLGTDDVLAMTLYTLVAGTFLALAYLRTTLLADHIILGLTLFNMVAAVLRLMWQVDKWRAPVSSLAAMRITVLNVANATALLYVALHFR
jgi:hypothetical protein